MVPYLVEPALLPSAAAPSFAVGDHCERRRMRRMRKMRRMRRMRKMRKMIEFQ